ncbi:MAG: hypothetical protein KME47_09340 [Nodosilinea sp. WJT8-NPBG4]|jgi:hypothetical protein|nr:hypothetical protein [Nodosilinea sp. WJT8-NPBG4]
MAEGTYELPVTGRDSNLASFDVFQDGLDSSGNALLRSIVKQEVAFTAIVNAIKTAVETSIPVVTEPLKIVDTNSFTVAVSATKANVVAAEPNRGSFFVRNIGAETVWLHLKVSTNANVVAGQGIQMNPGDAYEITVNNLYTGAISAVCGVGDTSSLAGFEGYIV